ncbi:MAG: 4-alpha-glucanotransferase [Oscillospiraceae bacterium]|nr:4-alpha-glucanotransferase [Oscillospiraceae bacterium]
MESQCPEKNRRVAGVLMPLSALPGAYGGGTLGAQAVRFAARLAAGGFSLWQMLPVNPVGAGNSPYSSPSAFAGNLFLIDPEELQQAGLLSADDLPDWRCESPHAVDYDFLRATRVLLLRRVFDAAPASALAAVAAFHQRARDWLDDYAHYQTQTEGETPDFWIFAQWIFDTQWRTFQTKVHALGVQLVGDIPFYVAAQSADFVAHPELFVTDGAHLTQVAGVPPDYFTPRGQLWGNPLYDWAAHRADGYRWWRARVARVLDLFDRVRLDHFRALSRYYAVPADAPDATEGVWQGGPGMELLSALPHTEHLIAEDLGQIDDDVRDLLRESGLPGMRVLQFAFDGDGHNIHLPHNYPKNCVAYTGTHDNNTLLGYIWEADAAERARALAYLDIAHEDWGCGGTAAPIVRAACRTLGQSAAETVIVPLQDLLGYGADTRTNTPGVAGGNWTFRVTEAQLETLDTAALYAHNDRYGRAGE